MRTFPSHITLPDDSEQPVIVHYDYESGEPESGPTYSSGGEPAVEPSVDIVSVKTLDGVDVLDTLSAAEVDRLRDDAWEHVEAKREENAELWRETRDEMSGRN